MNRNYIYKKMCYFIELFCYFGDIFLKDFDLDIYRFL